MKPFSLYSSRCSLSDIIAAAAAARRPPPAVDSTTKPRLIPIDLDLGILVRRSGGQTNAAVGNRSGAGDGSGRAERVGRAQADGQRDLGKASDKH